MSIFSTRFLTVPFIFCIIDLIFDKIVFYDSRNFGLKPFFDNLYIRVKAVISNREFKINL